MKALRPYQQIPTEIVTYVFINDLVKPFQIFMYIKCYSDGILNRASDTYLQMPTALGWGLSHNTVNRHLRRLVDINWIGYNSKSKNFFIRGFKNIIASQNLVNRQSVLFFSKNLIHMKAFLGAVIISCKINNQKRHFLAVARKMMKPAVKIPGVAIQGESSSGSVRTWIPSRDRNNYLNFQKELVDKPDYNGYSNFGISKILQCSKTAATVLKKEMARRGFIKIKPHKVVFATLPKADYKYRSLMYETYPELTGRLFFRIKLKKTKKMGPKKSIQVMLQRHDEIIPKLHFTKVAHKKPKPNSTVALNPREQLITTVNHDTELPWV